MTGSSPARAWHGLFGGLRGRGIDVHAAELHAPVLERARGAGLVELVGEDHVSLTLEEAIRKAAPAAV